MNPPLHRYLGPISGFTLIELIVAMTVAGILLGMAVPSFHGAIQDARLSAAIEPVRLALHTARSEAVKGSRRVTVCPLASELTCGSDWQAGLMVFMDSRAAFNETLAVRDDDDVVLRMEEGAGANATLSVFASNDRTAASLYMPAFIRFGSSGQSNWLNGSLVACDDRGADAARVLNVALSGDIRTGRRFDGVLEDVFGRPVVCP